MSREHSEVTKMTRRFFVTGQNRDLFVTLLESTLLGYAKGIVDIAALMDIRCVLVIECHTNYVKLQTFLLLVQFYLLFALSVFLGGTGAGFDLAGW